MLTLLVYLQAIISGNMVPHSSSNAFKAISLLMKQTSKDVPSTVKQAESEKNHNLLVHVTKRKEEQIHRITENMNAIVSLIQLMTSKNPAFMLNRFQHKSAYWRLDSQWPHIPYNNYNTGD